MSSFGTKLVRQVVSSPASEWLASPTSPTIENDEVHVWKVDLSATVPDVRLLSRDEHERAARFHFEKDRQHFKASRSALRIILGRYLNLPPESLEFAQTEYGKPFLTNLEAAGVLFNLSNQGRSLLSPSRASEKSGWMLNSCALTSRQTKSPNISSQWPRFTRCRGWNRTCAHRHFSAAGRARKLT